ncbi:MAG: hypothetical protein AB2L18_06695 [Anaerolineaceae bacterium]
MLERILTIIAWIGLGAYALVFLSAIPVLVHLLFALIKRQVDWPGPYIYDPQDVRSSYSAYSAMQKPKTLFITFLSKLGFFAALITLILVFIFVYFPQLETFTTFRVVVFVVLFVFFSFGGLLEVKPFLGLTTYLRKYLKAPNSGRFK